MMCLCVLSHIQRKIREADTIIQDTGMKLMDSAEQLMNTRLVQKNIISTIDTLNLCIPGKNPIENYREYVLCYTFGVTCPAGYRFHMFYIANTLAILTYSVCTIFSSAAVL